MDEGFRLSVYRAKAVENARTSSERMIGTQINPQEVLDTLRETVGVESSTNIPLPNSGITIRLA
jgi:hypothetical protein